jgi:hypothetical protein
MNLKAEPASVLDSGTLDRIGALRKVPKKSIPPDLDAQVVYARTDLVTKPPEKWSDKTRRCDGIIRMNLFRHT